MCGRWLLFLVGAATHSGVRRVLHSALVLQLHRQLISSRIELVVQAALVLQPNAIGAWQGFALRLGAVAHRGERVMRCATVLQCAAG